MTDLQIARRQQRDNDREAQEFADVIAAALRRSIRAGLPDGITAQGSPEAAGAALAVDELVAIEQAWRTELQTTVPPAVLAFLRRGATDALEQLALTAPVLFDSLRHPLAELHIAQSVNRLRGVGTALWETTRDQIVAGMQEGESIPQISSRIREVIDSSESRARTIARTEVVSASNAGSFRQVMDLDPSVRPVGKTWLATEDDRTRLTHRAANGQNQLLASTFEVGGANLMYPGDPTGPPDEVINCRCTNLWITSDDMEGLT